MKKLQLFLLGLFCSLFTIAQNQLYIEGRILDDNKQPLVGANILWEGTNIGSTSDVDGYFRILKLDTAISNQLLISYVGFQNVTIQSSSINDYQKIILTQSVQIEDVEINSKVNTTTISFINPIQVENISAEELCKAACCNLAESFETNASVDVGFSDALTGLRSIKMLGLDGDYLQITRENMPFIRGISSSYGLEFIPGSWIENIQLSKGVGSVLNGFESTTGQINIDLYNAKTSPLFFFNGFLSDSKEETNIILSSHYRDWLSAFLFHASVKPTASDHNKDAFLDYPLGSQINFLQRLEYIGNDDLYFTFSIQGLKDEKYAGSDDFNIFIENKMLNFFNKTGWKRQDSPGKSIALQSDFKIHEFNSNFSSRFFNVQQSSVYLNFIHQSYWSSEDHAYRAGMSYYMDKYAKAGIIDTSFLDWYSGGFLEYNYSGNDLLEVLLGLRLDYYNSYGFFSTPKLQIRLNPFENMIVRISGGRGFRKSEPILENTGALSSNRVIHIQNDLKPEIADNFGINIAKSFSLFEREGQISVDGYYTKFKSQVILNLETQGILKIENLEGNSYSKVFQLDFNYELLDRLDVKSSYKIQNVISSFSGQEKTVPFVPENQVLVNVAYETFNEKWKFDFTMKKMGSSRVPFHTDISSDQISVNDQGDLKSKPYNLFNSQITYLFKDVQLYVGAENFLNYTQENPILSIPNKPNFDASLVWAPTMGRMFYIGLRYILKE